MIYQTLANALHELLDRTHDSFGMLVMELRADKLPPLVDRLRTEFEFRLLLDITAIDYPQRIPRFDVVYHLYSRPHNRRVRLKVPVPEDRPIVPTLTTFYGSARFMEREMHDMYGVQFAGNDDLRPILLYEGFEGHPLRKDYSMDREQPIVPYRQ